MDAFAIVAIGTGTFPSLLSMEEISYGSVDASSKEYPAKARSQTANSSRTRHCSTAVGTAIAYDTHTRDQTEKVIHTLAESL
jgi:hypothetical protein